MSRLQNAVQQLKPKNQPILDNADRVLRLVPLSEAVTTEATEAEMAICVAYNKKKGSKTPVEDAGIPLTKWEKVEKKIRTIGEKVVADSKLGNLGSRLIHSGSGSATNFYKLGRDVTPKADFVGDNDNYISLKKAGDSGSGAQLMSAKSGEATGVVEAAVLHFQKNTKQDLSKDKDFKNAIDILSRQMEKTARNDLNVEVAKAKTDFETWYITQSSRKQQLEKIERNKKKVTDYLKLELSFLGATRQTQDTENKLKTLIPRAKIIKKKEFNKIKDEYIKDDTYQVGDVKVSAKHLTSVAPEKLQNPELKKQIVDIIETSVNTKPWQEALTNFFNKNDDLKRWMVYEAASGLYKFTGNPSDGKEYTKKQSAVANKILVFTDNGVKSKHKVIDYAMANPGLVNKISISYKGSGRSKYIKLGIAASYEHELPMLREELKELERRYVLNEGIFRDVVNKAKTFYNSVKNIVKRFYENIIKRFFIQLYELAKQGITVLLDALGLEISKAEVSMATPSW